MKKITKGMILTISAFVASLFMAREWVNAPALWPPIPTSAWLAVDWLIKPVRDMEVHNQEEQVEFIMFWILSVLVIALVSVVGWQVRKFMHPNRRDDKWT